MKEARRSRHFKVLALQRRTIPQADQRRHSKHHVRMYARGKLVQRPPKVQPAYVCSEKLQSCKPSVNLNLFPDRKEALHTAGRYLPCNTKNMFMSKCRSSPSSSVSAVEPAAM